MAAVSWDGGGDGTNWTDPNNWSGNVTNPTGVKAFSGNVQVTGSTTLAPGVYIIDGSDNSGPILIQKGNKK